ncbi:MAG: head-tail connector protein [Sulfitobacter sp.]
MLIEETNIPDAVLPVAAFKAHMRMGTGFAEETLQDAVIAGFLRAAIAAVETRTGKALIAREFTQVVQKSGPVDGVMLGVAPVDEVIEVQSLDRAGAAQVIDAGAYWLERDAQTPRVRSVASYFAHLDIGGEVRVRVLAGFGTAWEDVPMDMGQAVLMLAAHYYEYRHDTALTNGCMPFGVTSLIERYRSMRLGRSGAQT